MVAKRVGDQRRARAHARRRGRGLAAGMAAADHDDVELVRQDIASRSLRGFAADPNRTWPREVKGARSDG